MPRIADPRTSQQVLETASRLLDSGSADAVTMRALAHETGVAVTTIYERFDGRAGLLRALALHVASEEAARLSKWHTIEQVFDHYLQFAQAHPHRYQLMSESFVDRLTTGEVPGFQLLKGLLAARLGGTPESHSELALGLVELLGGTVKALTTAGDNQAFAAKATRAAKYLLASVLQGAAISAERKKRVP